VSESQTFNVVHEEETNYFLHNLTEQLAVVAEINTFTVVVVMRKRKSRTTLSLTDPSVPPPDDCV